MQRAANLIEQRRSIRSVAKDFNHDKKTLQRFIKICESNPNAVAGYASMRDAHLVITPAMEQNLENHAKL